MPPFPWLSPGSSSLPGWQHVRLQPSSAPQRPVAIRVMLHMPLCNPHADQVAIQQVSKCTRLDSRPCLVTSRSLSLFGNPQLQQVRNSERGTTHYYQSSMTAKPLSRRASCCLLHRDTSAGQLFQRRYLTDHIISAVFTGWPGSHRPRQVIALLGKALRLQCKEKRRGLIMYM